VGTTAEVEDLVADVFLRAAEHLSGFEYRGEASFAAWLFRIAHNHLHNYYRGRRRGGTLPLEAVPDMPDMGPGLDFALTRREQAAQLRELINGLSPRRREVILLRFFGGLRNREIAKVLGIDERAVSSHLARGITDLRRRYQESPETTGDGDSYASAAPVEQADR
jgi:RNA polymerase sigma-70 factor (ECF subfamily)